MYDWVRYAYRKHYMSMGVIIRNALRVRSLREFMGKLGVFRNLIRLGGQKHERRG